MPRERFYQKLGLHLVQATQNELDFLQQVDECPSLYKSSSLKNAIRRYEVFWLPLAAREGYGSRFLAAPLDIAWVWHVHMLSPYNYEQDCLNCVSKIVDHVPLGDLERRRGLEKARYLWEREYPDEPFEVDLSQSQIVQMDCNNSKIQYDLERACYRQFKFYYQVSLPHYRDAKFLEKAVERYEHHVMFNKQNPGVFVVPCYDFDLIWHVHQLHPVNYNQTTKRFLGQVLHHDDSATSHSPGSLLCDSEEKTRSLWKAAGLQFALPGTMYRGDPPDPVPPRSRWSYVPLARREYVVDILQVETFNMNKKTFLIQLEDPQQDEIFSHSFQGNRAVKNLNTTRFSVDNGENHKLTAKIYRKKLLLQSEFIALSSVSVLTFLDAAPVSGALTASVAVSFKDDDGQYMAQITMIISPAAVQEYNFEFKTGTFYAHKHPSEVLNNPQLVLPPKDLANPILVCSSSSEKIIDWREKEAFNYRIVHSSYGLISAVEVLNREQQVVASAHTINQSVLPQAEAVQDANKCIVLNQTEGERAMLIRGENKDWGVCIGNWQEEITPKDAKKYVVNRFVSIRFFKLFREQGWCLVRKSGGIFVIKVDSNTVMRLNMTNSKVYISPHSQAIPEVLALSLSIAVLHLLCMPYVPQEGMESSHDDQVSVRDPIISPMLLAAGFYCRIVPTNVYMNRVLGKDSCASCGGYYGLATYDFNEDPVREWNKGPVSRCGRSSESASGNDDQEEEL